MIDVHRHAEDHGEITDRIIHDRLPQPASSQALPAEEHELERPLSGQIDAGTLHAELGDLKDFAGVVRRGDRIFATFRARPSKGALALARARSRAHQGGRP